MAGKLTLQTLKRVVAERVKGPGFESLFDQLSVISGGDGLCCCELKVSPKMLNVSGSLHGGVTASLIDAVSTYALMTTGTGRPGSSIDLNISYMRPIKLDDVIVISAKTLNCGKKIAVSTVDISSKQTGKLVAQGRHTKFVGDPKVD
ncbi:acyl-coenzyme A thioesterase 13-like [Physella acuta]|uniref:acyl-coenzyme A thioesterase 13-like n=1 Tax=Physella acuta TaxID=109671 RepID=UPI0027DAEA08|nr:acyl-coenzyme A thioesterase 13-like [Physella acuta]